MIILHGGFYRNPDNELCAHYSNLLRRSTDASLVGGDFNEILLEVEEPNLLVNFCLSETAIEAYGLCEVGIKLIYLG